MEAFGIIGMSFGTLGFIFSLNALGRIDKLEKQLIKMSLRQTPDDSGPTSQPSSSLS